MVLESSPSASTSATADSKRRSSSRNSRRAPAKDRRIAGMSVSDMLQRPEVRSQMKRMGITNSSHTGRLINAVSGELGNVDAIVSAMGGLGNMREAAASGGSGGQTLGTAHSDILKRLNKVSPNLVKRVGQRIMGEMSSGRANNEELLKEITAMSESDEFKNSMDASGMDINPSILFKSALAMTKWLRADGQSIVFAPFSACDVESPEATSSWHATFAQFAAGAADDADAKPDRDIAWIPMMSAIQQHGAEDADAPKKVDVDAHIMDVLLAPCLVSKFVAGDQQQQSLLDADTRAIVADAMRLAEVGGRSGRHSSDVLLPSAQSVFFVGNARTSRPVAVVPCTRSCVPHAIELAVAATRAFRELPDTATCMVRIHDESEARSSSFSDLPALGPRRAVIPPDAFATIDGGGDSGVLVFKVQQQ